MPLINCKVELKLKWAKHCVLVTGSIEYTNDITFTIKDTLYIPVVTLSSKGNQNY